MIEINLNQCWWLQWWRVNLWERKSTAAAIWAQDCLGWLEWQLMARLVTLRCGPNRHFLQHRNVSLPSDRWERWILSPCTVRRGSCHVLMAVHSACENQAGSIVAAAWLVSVLRRFVAFNSYCTVRTLCWSCVITVLLIRWITGYNYFLKSIELKSGGDWSKCSRWLTYGGTALQALSSEPLAVFNNQYTLQLWEK